MLWISTMTPGPGGAFIIQAQYLSALTQNNFRARGSKFFPTTLYLRREKQLEKNSDWTQVLLLCKQDLQQLDLGSSVR